MKFKIQDREVGENQPCFIIAEVGVNHNNDLEIAKKMIDVAVEAGCDAVKLQILTAKGLYVRDAGRVTTDSGDDVDAFEIWKNVEVPDSWIPELKEYCLKKEIIFFSSVFDEKTVDLLNPYVDLFKIASSETNHLPLLKKVAKTGKPVIISIGGATMEEVEEAVSAVKEEGNNQISLLYCVQKYPTPLESANVLVVKTLKEKFPGLVIGYSDHSLNPGTIPSAAVVKGAKIIEKHFTLSRSMEGIDHKMSLQPDELKQMVTDIRNTEEKLRNGETVIINPILIGNGKIELTKEQERNLSFVRRKIFALKPIAKGEKFSEENLSVLRPGNRGSEEGLHPRDYFDLLGKIANKEIPHLGMIKKEDFSENIVFEDLILTNYVDLTDEEKMTVLNWRNHENIRKWMLTNHIISKEEHYSFLEKLKVSKTHHCWLVKHEGNPIGMVSLLNVDEKNKRASFGAYADPESSDMGRGLRLFKVISHIAFDKFKLHSLRGETIEDNPILFLHQKFGFEIEGRMRHYVSKDGRWKDVIITSKINEENQNNHLQKMLNKSLTVGVDIENINRFKGLSREKDRLFFGRLYTERELDYCFSKSNPAQHLAVRFAGKEAVLKALNSLGRTLSDFKKIEILRSTTGVPSVKLHDSSFSDLKLEISLSHSENRAIAFVICTV